MLASLGQNPTDASLDAVMNALCGPSVSSHSSPPFFCQKDKWHGPQEVVRDFLACIDEETAGVRNITSGNGRQPWAMQTRKWMSCTEEPQLT